MLSAGGRAGAEPGNPLPTEQAAAAEVHSHIPSHLDVMSGLGAADWRATSTTTSTTDYNAAPTQALVFIVHLSHIWQPSPWSPVYALLASGVVRSVVRP
jgi:hypothetical protein